MTDRLSEIRARLAAQGWRSDMELTLSRADVEYLLGRVAAWIPVGEGLPDFGHKCLVVLFPDKHVEVDWRAEVRGPNLELIGTRWVRYPNDVDYWMPLPEPPVQPEANPAQLKSRGGE
jgi:hypothetical protein